MYTYIRYTLVVPNHFTYRHFTSQKPSPRLQPSHFLQKHIHFTSLHFTSQKHFTYFTSLHSVTETVPTPAAVTSLHFTSLHFTSLHFTSLHFTSLHFTSLHFTSLHFTSLHACSRHRNHASPHMKPSSHM